MACQTTTYAVCSENAISIAALELAEPGPKPQTAAEVTGCSRAFMTCMAPPVPPENANSVSRPGL
jgi:hypothetical protein